MISMNQPTLQELVDRVMARNQGLWASPRTAVLPQVDSFQPHESAGETPATTERLWHR